MKTNEKIELKEVLGCITVGIVMAAVFVLRIIF